MYASIACIGYGNMGAAFLKGIHGQFPDCRLAVLEKDSGNAQKAKSECQARVARDLQDLLKGSEALVLAFKPQDAVAFLDAIRESGWQGHILSILGGKTSTWIAERAGVKQVARYMPSLAAAVGAGAVALCHAPGASQELQESSLAIARAVGQAHVIPEHLMAAFTGLSGSGIAFAWSFAHGLAMGGVQNGMSYPQSLAVVLDMMEGAARMLRENGEQPIPMVTKVCSPAGTTIEGMACLEAGGFQHLCMEAVGAVVRRSNALEAASPPSQSVSQMLK